MYMVHWMSTLQPKKKKKRMMQQEKLRAEKVLI